MTMLINIALSLMTTVLPLGSGELFDFHLESTRRTFKASENNCQSLGYDGLAVLKSPEMFRYALRISEAIRALGSTYGPYVGLRNNSETLVVSWDDGSLPAEDTPWGTPAIARDYTTWHYTNIEHSANYLRSNPGSRKKPSICGYHTNNPTEAHGVSSPGLQASGVRSSLSVSTVVSYLECALLCGQDYRCRVAEFNAGHLTCRLLGPGSYTGFITSSKWQVFVRNGFYA